MSLTVKQIINQVRWCVDEESGSTGDYEDKYFDNIVKAKIGASLRWCALNADSVMLTDGNGTNSNSFATDFSVTVPEGETTVHFLTPTSKFTIGEDKTATFEFLRTGEYDIYSGEEANMVFEDGTFGPEAETISNLKVTFRGGDITDDMVGKSLIGINVISSDPAKMFLLPGCYLPTNNFKDGFFILPATTIRVLRVKSSGWTKGVSNLIEEDSDEYLMQSDDVSKATKDRPIVALIRTNPLKMQLFPQPEVGDTVEFSVINAINPDISTDTSEDTAINIPTKMEGAFLYYLAYLVMCAHSDFNKASAMLEIAKQQILATTSQS